MQVMGRTAHSVAATKSTTSTSTLAKPHLRLLHAMKCIKPSFNRKNEARIAARSPKKTPVIHLGALFIVGMILHFSQNGHVYSGGDPFGTYDAAGNEIPLTLDQYDSQTLMYRGHARSWNDLALMADVDSQVS